MARYLLVLIAFFMMAPRLVAQNDVEEMMKKLQDATRNYIDNTEKAVQDFIDKDDAEFAKFLEEDWQMFQAFKGEVLNKEPKPKTIPVAEEKTEQIYTGKKVEKVSVPTSPKKKKVESKREYTFRPDVQKRHVTVGFFDVDHDLAFDARMQSLRLSNINNKSISKCWETLSSSDYSALLEQTKIYKNNMNLNDWGYILFLYKIGTCLYNESENESILFTWFMMSKSGYDIKIGYDDSSVYLLIPTENMIYSTSYLVMDGRRYFILSPGSSNENSVGLIYTYKEDYPGQGKTISMNLENPPVFKKRKISKEYKFKYKETYYTVPVIYYKDAVDFYENYPQTNFEVYFSSKVTPAADYSFFIAFKPLIENKSEAEAVNIILRFVQTAFKYKTDDENFGREKPLFPEETLYYEFSDCEDRSILFAHLVRQLLGLEVIGLSYPGHIATAVKFHSQVNGDHVLYKQTNYLICDPTYINADIGQCMPQFRGVRPEIIHF